MPATSANRADPRFALNSNRDSFLVEDDFDDFLPEGSVARLVVQMRRALSSPGRLGTYLLAAVVLMALVIGALAGRRLLTSSSRTQHAPAQAAAAPAAEPSPTATTPATSVTKHASSSAAATTVRKPAATAVGSGPARRTQAGTRPGAYSVPTPASLGAIAVAAPRRNAALVTTPATVVDAATDSPNGVAALPDTTVYSARDAGVTPPKMLSADVPRPTFASMPTITNSMELIVSPEGEVEHVQLVTAPQRMTDMMILSSAKLWKFAPATKDGHPVRYRLRITWQVNP